MNDPKPYYQDDAVTIYLGDCREILPSVGQVDLILTDPTGVFLCLLNANRRNHIRSAVAGQECLDLGQRRGWVRG